MIALEAYVQKETEILVECKRIDEVAGHALLTKMQYLEDGVPANDISIASLSKDLERQNVRKTSYEMDLRQVRVNLDRTRREIKFLLNEMGELNKIIISQHICHTAIEHDHPNKEIDVEIRNYDLQGVGEDVEILTDNDNQGYYRM